MQYKKSKLTNGFSLLLLIISPIILSPMLIQVFSNDSRLDSEDFKQSVPLVSSVDSELVMIWNHTYGEYKEETVKSLVRLPNGNYILSGYLNVSDNFDVMIRCFTPNGNSLWNQTFGYAEDDYGFQVIGCSSGGVAVVGRITNTTAIFDNNDAGIIRIAANGTQLWNSTYIGPEQTASSTEDDRGYSIVECGNGDFVVAGVTGITDEGSIFFYFQLGFIKVLYKIVLNQVTISN